MTSSQLITSALFSSLRSGCNEECSCSTVLFNPVCGEDNRTYFSPCFGGCKDTPLVTSTNLLFLRFLKFFSKTSKTGRGSRIVEEGDRSAAQGLRTITTKLFGQRIPEGKVRNRGLLCVNYCQANALTTVLARSARIFSDSLGGPMLRTQFLLAPREMRMGTGQCSDKGGLLSLNPLSQQPLTLYRTTNSAQFDPELAVKFDPQGQKSLMVSSIQHGDTNLVPFPTSEVRGNYRGEQGPQVPARVGRYPPHINYNPNDTLRTDRREPLPYNTAHSDFHTGEFKPARKQPFGEAAQKRGGNSFELKTEDKPIFSTNVRDDYVQQKFTSPRYNKPEAVKQVTKSTFVFGTETPFAGNCLSSDTTNRALFTGTSYGPTLSLKPENVFHSDFPKGDVDAERTRLLQNDTSYGEHFPIRAPGQIINPKVRGEEIITRSRVEFGNENEALSSSTRSCYLPHMTLPPNRVDQLVKFQNGFSLGSPDVETVIPLGILLYIMQIHPFGSHHTHIPLVVDRPPDQVTSEDLIPLNQASDHIIGI
eukprot:sb/3463750/